MLLFLVATIVTGKKDTVVMKRRMSKDVMMRAITIATIAFVFVGFITMLLCIVEQSHLAASDLLFETVSAFATVGLSTGITHALSPVSQILIIITMFAGRVGVFTVSMAVAEAQQQAECKQYTLSEERIMIG